MQPEVVTFGETMVIFDPSFDGPLRYVHQFQKGFGGAESNVAIGVTRLGHTAGWISQVGRDELGTYLINVIRSEGVDVSRVTKTDEGPTGLYLKERVRGDATNVYYYRAGSAASHMHKNLIDWEYVKQAKILHVSGITPFLSESCLELTMEMVRFAKENDIYVVFDPNLRMKIIKKFPDHIAVLKRLAGMADLFLPGLDEARYLFGDKSAEELLDLCLQEGADSVVIKDGAHGSYYASDMERGFTESHQVEKIVDPIGAGDGFAAGVITGLLEDLSLREAVGRGAAIGAMMVTVKGDIERLPTKEEIESFSGPSQDVSR